VSEGAARFSLRRAVPADMPAVARLHRAVREACLPYLPDLHTPAEDLAFFRDHVFPHSIVWLAEAGGKPVGYAAMRGDWLDHLYVDPAWHSRGVGTALLRATQEGRAHLQLWTFQKNAQARPFYEQHGFVPTEFTDGSGNDEKEPDIRYVWVA
jgi:Sortase and related acyltransferases